MADLESIIQQLQAERDRLDAAISALTSVNSNKPQTRRTTRRLSAAARARIAAAQRARWAKTKSTQTKPKRRISAAGLARIRAAQKARWAKAKQQKKAA